MGKKKTKELKIDFGCGTRKQDGFIGVDKIAFKGVDVVIDLGKEIFPWDDNSVDEGYSAHFVEHLSVSERIHFFNELYRVLKKDAKATIICPYWASSRSYGDPTHQWPPVGEYTFSYLNKEWRTKEAPHTDIKNWEGGYSCNFDATWGYGMHQMLSTRNQDFQQFAITFYKEAAQDIHTTLTKL